MSDRSLCSESLNHLLIMRHGQAEVYADIDQQRSLTDKGLQEVRETGGQVLECLQSLNPQHLVILVSTAKRTQQTWNELKFQIDLLNIPHVNIQIQSDLYLATYDHLYHVILEYLPYTEHQKTILLIGHNPGLSNLVNQLSGSWLSLQTAQWVHLTSQKDLARWTLLT